MSNLSFIFSLLYLCLFTAPPALATDHSKITWTQSLSTEKAVTDYLASKHGMASEVLSLSADSPPVVKMGKDPTNTFTLTKCLEMMKTGRKHKELFLDVPSLEAYKAVKAELDADAKKWVTLNLRIFQGPNGDNVTITPKEVHEHIKDGVKKCVGMTSGEGNQTGYSSVTLNDVETTWRTFNWTKISILFDIVYVSNTEDREGAMLSHLVKDHLPHRIYYMTAKQKKDVKMDVLLKHLIEVDYRGDYFDVPGAFQDKLLEQLSFLPTPGPGPNPDFTETTTASSGDGILGQMRMILGLGVLFLLM